MTEKHKLYTMTVDYSATGEGRTIMAWVGYCAPTETDINSKILKQFGGYFADCVNVKEGFDSNNEQIKFLFTRDVISFIDRNKDDCFLDLSACMHFNFS